MNSVYEYPTRQVMGNNLDNTMTLVGESGGLSSIYDSGFSSAMPGMLAVETEHGFLYLDPDEDYTILAMEGEDDLNACSNGCIDPENHKE